MDALAPPLVYQRATGDVRITLADDRGRPRLARSYQAGSGKLRFPRVPSGMEAMVLNTAGGLAGGDVFSLDVSVEAHALTTSTQASERIYRAEGGRARVVQTMRVAGGATLRHMPQPTILFDGAGLTRRTTVHLAEGARFTFCEGMVLGRQAMGETVRALALSDWTEVHLAGRLAFADAVRLDTGALTRAATPAMLGENLAFGLVLHHGPDLAGARDSLAAILRHGGASVVGGVLVARLLAPSHGALQDELARAVTHLSGTPPPRAWQL